MSAEEQVQELERFARERGIGLLEALAIAKLVMELLDLPQVQELIQKIKDALSD